jgi:hypothetical protein
MTETKTGHGGLRIRPPGSLPPGRKPLNPNGAQVKVNARLDPDVYRKVAAYAADKKISFNRALNELLIPPSAEKENES